MKLFKQTAIVRQTQGGNRWTSDKREAKSMFLQKRGTGTEFQDIFDIKWLCNIWAKNYHYCALIKNTRCYIHISVYKRWIEGGNSNQLNSLLLPFTAFQTKCMKVSLETYREKKCRIGGRSGGEEENNRCERYNAA